jgi:hypothetical protein
LNSIEIIYRKNTISMRIAKKCSYVTFKNVVTAIAPKKLSPIKKFDTVNAMAR